MVRVALILSLLTSVAFLSFACGGKSGDDPADAATGNSSEDELARSMLLTLSDFPTGWAEEPDDSEESPFDECDPGPAQGRTGHAETGDFSSDGTASISESLSTFSTADETRSALDQISSKADCFVAVVDDGKLDDDEATYSDASFSRLSFPEHGNRTEAYRISIHAKAKNETGFGSEGDIYVDLVNVTVDRVGFTVLASNVLSPFDSDDLDDYVSIAEARVSETLSRMGSSTPVQNTPVRVGATAQPSATATAVQEPHVGEAQETSSGNTMRIYAYEAPVPSTNEFLAPDPGNVFAAIDVEGCTSSSPSASMSVNPFEFRLQLPDNTRIEPTFSGREPALNGTNLLANDCVRGFVTFEIPEGTTPSYVVYEGYDEDFDPLILKWKVSQ
ncbi:MAG: DUF4352 domain-containing protein [Dehalococcoidia bacterium]